MSGHETLAETIDVLLAQTKPLGPDSSIRVPRYNVVDLVEVLKTMLSDDERAYVIDVGLRETVTARIREARRGTTPAEPKIGATPVERKGIRIMWPSDDKLIEYLNKGLETQSKWNTIYTLANELGVSDTALKSHLTNRRLMPDAYSGYSTEIFSEIADLALEYGKRMQDDGIRIGLERANTERVFVTGEWRILGDLSADELQTLVDDYSGRAASNLEKGAQYQAIVNEMHARGSATVRDLALLQEEA